MAAIQITGQALPGIFSSAQKAGPGAAIPTGWNTEPLESDLLPHFSHLTQAGVVYSAGMQLNSISNATFTTADGLSSTLATAATATPIIGLWNPLNSGVNAHVLGAVLAAVITAATATGCGGFIWAVFSNQGALTAANQQIPVNRKTFTQSGSQCKGVSGIALTGLTQTGFFLATSGLNGGAAANFSEVGTAVGFIPSAEPGFELLDGSIIVPPGGVLALFCSTTPVAHSAAGSITWAELPA